MAIAVMMNNFFHDFAVALLATSLIAIWYCSGGRAGLDLDARRRIYRFFGKVTFGCWVWIVIGGGIRSWAYYDYEYLPAAGRGQIAALVIKHILLVSLVVFGVWIQVKIKRHLFPKAGAES